ncbi:hypothetical protein [Methyloraptor flagellatus]|uniref:Uncharacterized protein n=1 Tax=Methyloraptor flagellatus TaxID=3162530 RepID=A0AAU7XAM0_9HYPH
MNLKIVSFVATAVALASLPTAAWAGGPSLGKVYAVWQGQSDKNYTKIYDRRWGQDGVACEAAGNNQAVSIKFYDGAEKRWIRYERNSGAAETDEYIKVASGICTRMPYGLQRQSPVAGYRFEEIAGGKLQPSKVQ